MCDKIDQLAKDNNFPIKDVMEMDGSSRSAHSNAFFTGIFGSKKIVLFDTLLKQCTMEEIVAVICHEIGHFKYGHINIRLVLNTVITIGMLYLFQIVSQSKVIFEAFGVGVYEGYGISGTPAIIALNI